MDRAVEVYISGPLGKALYKENDQCYIVGKYGCDGPVECDHWDISQFFDFGKEYDVVSIDDFNITKLMEKLNRSSDAHFTLNMMICAMDEEMDDDVRRSSLKAAMEYLDIQHIYAFVRNRLLCRLLPNGADIERAIEIAESLNAAKAVGIYKEVKRSQDTIKNILTIWSEVSEKMFISKKEISLNEKILIEAGFFSEMISAIEINDVNKLKSIVSTYSNDVELKKLISDVVRLLNTFMLIIKSRLETHIHIYTSVDAGHGRKPNKEKESTNITYTYRRYYRTPKGYYRTSSHYKLAYIIERNRSYYVAQNCSKEFLEQFDRFLDRLNGKNASFDSVRRALLDIKINYQDQLRSGISNKRATFNRKLKEGTHSIIHCGRYKPACRGR
ncbi:MAG: hypothetical protein HQK97_01545 [Nitrospirae bacterium]|nr:hypothetical protein [Nitrospirota bacterium]